MRRRMTARRIATTFAVAALALGATACGTRNVEVPENEQANVKNGAHLFAERCGGCHTLNTVGARGSKPTNDVGGGERTNGPNFNVRKETRDDVLFAIRNGGFSGAIMPANIVVGQDAEDIAAYLEKYAGRGGSDVTEQQSPNQGQGSGGSGGGIPGG
jgi:mono/diheme cytochrome c family protein